LPRPRPSPKAPPRSLLARLVASAVAGTALLAWAAPADPEADRLGLIALYRQAFPQVPVAEYVYGALVFSRDAREQYDSLMDFPPFLGTLDRGREMWERRFGNGKTFADCFPDGGRNAAGRYPRYDAARERVVTFETALNDCLLANGEPALERSDMARMGVLTAYARTLSDGMPMQVEVNGPAALARYEAGREYFYRRQGPLNFACASCHVQNAGRILRTEYLSPAVGQATHWPVFRGGDALNTLQARYKRCLEQIRVAPPPIGSRDFDDLEYFHSYLSNGLPLKASVFRK
jgi:L-cysteine S-thiosulfotransferase